MDEVMQLGGSMRMYGRCAMGLCCSNISYAAVELLCKNGILCCAYPQDTMSVEKQIVVWQMPHDHVTLLLHNLSLTPLQDTSPHRGYTLL
jgi:hypothetical protein